MANLSPISLSGTLPTVPGDAAMTALESEDQGFVQELQGALEQQSGAAATRAQTLDAESDSPDKSSQDESDQQNLPSNAWVMLNPSANFAGVPWAGQPEDPVMETNPASADAVAQMGAGLAQMAAVSSINVGSPGGMDAVTPTVSSSPLTSPELPSSAMAVPVSTAVASAQAAPPATVDDVAMVQTVAGQSQARDQVSGVATDAVVRAATDVRSSALVGATPDNASQIHVSAASPEGHRVTGVELISSARALSASALHTSPENAGVGVNAFPAHESVLQADASKNALPPALATAARDLSEAKSIQAPTGAQSVSVAEVNPIDPAVARAQKIEAPDLAQPSLELNGVVSKTLDAGASGPQASALTMPSALSASVVSGLPVEVTTSQASVSASPVQTPNETNSDSTLVSGQAGQDMTQLASAVQTLAATADGGATPVSTKSMATGVEGPDAHVTVTSNSAVMDHQASTAVTASPLEPQSPPVLMQAAADMAAAGALQAPRAKALERAQEVVRQETDPWPTEATASSDTVTPFNLFASTAQSAKEGAHAIDATRAGVVGSSPASSVSERAPSVEVLQAASADVSADTTNASGTDSSFTHSFMQTLMGHGPAVSALAEHRVLEPDVTPSALAPHQVQLDAGPVHVEIVRLVKQGGGQVVLALTPPDQTTFKIDLSIDAQGVARLVVDGGSDSTRSRLEQGVTQLQEQFTQMGLQLQFDMRQQRDDTRAQDQAWASGNPGSAPVATAQASSDTIARPRPAPASWAQGQVHLYA